MLAKKWTFTASTAFNESIFLLGERLEFDKDRDECKTETSAFTPRRRSRLRHISKRRSSRSKSHCERSSKMKAAPRSKHIQGDSHHLDLHRSKRHCSRHSKRQRRSSTHQRSRTRDQDADQEILWVSESEYLVTLKLTLTGKMPAYTLTVAEAVIILVDICRNQLRWRHLARTRTTHGGPGPSRCRSMATPGPGS